MEKLIILLLFAVGSALMNWYQQKQKKEQEKREADRFARDPSARTQPRPSSQPRPQRPAEWAEELRRLLDPNAPPMTPTGRTVPHVPPRLPPSPPRAQTPPIIIRGGPPAVQIPRELSEGDLLVQSPLRQSAAAYNQAAGLQQKVETRLKAIDEQTQKHPKRIITVQRKTRSARELVRAWKANPQTLREAILASIIFEKPQSF